MNIEDQFPLENEETNNNLLPDEQDTEFKDDDESVICFDKRLRKLIKAVSDSEEFDLEISQEGIKKIHDSIKFLTITLTFEIINQLRTKERKRIRPAHVDDALSKMMSKSDALGIALNELDLLRNKLEGLNNNSSLNKAMYFINFKDSNKGHDKNEF